MIISHINNLIWKNWIDKIPGTRLAWTYAPKASQGIATERIKQAALQRQAKAKAEKVSCKQAIMQRRAEDEQYWNKSEKSFCNHVRVEAEIAKITYNPMQAMQHTTKTWQLLKTPKTCWAAKTSIHSLKTFRTVIILGNCKDSPESQRAESIEEGDDKDDSQDGNEVEVDIQNCDDFQYCKDQRTSTSWTVSWITSNTAFV